MAALAIYLFEPQSRVFIYLMQFSGPWRILNLIKFQVLYLVCQALLVGLARKGHNVLHGFSNAMGILVDIHPSMASQDSCRQL